MIFGIDPGLANVGWFLLSEDEEEHSSGHIVTEKSGQVGDAMSRLAWVMYGLSTPLRHLAKAHAKGERTAAVIEWPGGAGGFQRAGSRNGNARAAIQTSTTAGAVYGALYWLYKGQISHILAPAPVTWRTALGKAWGIADDEETLHGALMVLHPSLVPPANDVSRITKNPVKPNPHKLDAAGLAHYGLPQNRKGLRV